MSDEPSCSNVLDPQLPRCAWLLACSVSRKDASPQSSASARRIPVRILSGNGVHRFRNHCSTSPEYATVAFYFHDLGWHKLKPDHSLQAKTSSFALVHFSVAFAVAYLLSGELLTGGVMALIEPAINTVVFFFHERLWRARQQLALA